MNIENVVSISGGKDSTALALLAIERKTENLHFVFADTGHEHAQTYEYLEYLNGVLLERAGVGITTVKADFSRQIAKKREFIQSKWAEHGVPQDRIDEALKILVPTGIPFLDLCLWKGRFPSTRARFCSSELKHIPIQQQVVDPLIEASQAVISWQGVRAQESLARRDLPERDVEFGSWEPEPTGLLIYRPIIAWTADEVFEYHRTQGVNWNPLYEQGMGRVGCMPCIHANKAELREIAKRFPAEAARVAQWEKWVTMASKRGLASFFASDKTPGDHQGRSDQAAPGIEAIMDWALTGRGGRQIDLLHLADSQEEEIACSSIYGLCE